MLNPSTADAREDDPTIRRCVGYARSWAYGSLAVVNLFAYRATAPKELRAAADPVGPENDQWIRDTVAGGLVVCAWGAHGAFQGRDREVARLLEECGAELHCLSVTKEGQPGHPLYLGAELRPVRWRLSG